MKRIVSLFLSVILLVTNMSSFVWASDYQEYSAAGSISYDSGSGLAQSIWENINEYICNIALLFGEESTGVKVSSISSFEDFSIEMGVESVAPYYPVVKKYYILYSFFKESYYAYEDLGKAIGNSLIASNKLYQSAKQSAEQGLETLKNIQDTAYQLGVQDRYTENEIPQRNLVALDNMIKSSKYRVQNIYDCANQFIMVFHPKQKKALLTYAEKYSQAFQSAVPAIKLYNFGRYGNENGPADMPQNDASTLSLINANYPTNLNKGAYYNLEGKITSNYIITSVTVGVQKSGTWQDVATKTVSPNRKSFSITEVDRSITFGLLSPGTYTYVINATDEKQTLTLLKKEFTVKGEYTTQKNNIEWSDWTEKLPDHIDYANYKVEEKIQYRFRVMPAVSASWSEWKDHKDSSSLVAKEECQTQIKTNQATGFVYGEWSDWQKGEGIQPNQNTDVETRIIEKSESVITGYDMTTNVYRYGTDWIWVNSPSREWRSKCTGWYGENYVRSNVAPEKLEAYKDGYKIKGDQGEPSNMSSCRWYITTEHKEEIKETIHEYRVREIRQLHSSSQSSGWSSWMDGYIPEDEVTQTRYRYRYKYYEGSSAKWSEWGDSYIPEEPGTEVETRELYRYQKAK